MHQVFSPLTIDRVAKVTAILILFATQSVSADCDYSAGPPDAEIAKNSTEARTIVSAWYGNATTRYRHGVLGDSIEALTLYAKTDSTDACAYSITLGDDSVFEDVTPRIADVTGDGEANVIVIESSIKLGASLAIYGLQEGALVKVATTPYIGQSNRWLAPVGIADFNADNVMDVAYVQTPHLGGIIKVWSFKDEAPVLLASARGFSNHRIGENTITGGINLCASQPTLVLPDQQWSKTLLATLNRKPVNGNQNSSGQYNSDSYTINTEVYADNADPQTINTALHCK